MNNFFERQKVDEIGITAVKLEKLLLVLFVLYFLPIFAMGPLGLLGFIFNGLIVLIAWKGSLHRREKWLRVYAGITTFFIVLSIVGLVVMFGLSIKYNSRTHHSLQNSPKVHHSEPPKHIVPSSSPTPSFAQHNTESVSSTTLVSLLVLALLYVLVIFALKVATVIISLRLSQQIKVAKAAHFAHPVLRKAPEPATFSGASYTPKAMYIPLDNSLPAYHDSIQVNNPNFSQTTFYFPNQHAQV
eukprot:TRINITY_DN598_c0_g1_i1.p1 TRINITY_DN598_c0_g1~~TRINITY_DN598_c0_g1_i1.p1  ORF type:complete len:243 (+),score=54.06 TRINITY_DN598_c0_g1_i1:120-848(+)